MSNQTYNKDKELTEQLGLKICTCGRCCNAQRIDALEKGNNKLIKDLEKTLQEWTNMLESQGEDWEMSEVQLGEIQGLQYAIDTIKGKYDRIHI